ncbi:DUF4064 domain-containing protein [Planococcus sp. N028]|uniref:DUF4064 domain-containing protein n=1 Tax=Planococcus shixiaomingii TaxID=3058393 RepID=A0ABT8N6S0_9BACL|nr:MULTISPECIES: DUF4064 domain-containing protein [unclassified Planococcus (in: firmicutes)]MDN7243352.1 DUF4064 domain-containing protein [Planococcus sp. N028]WKA55293.1 DUF4064 domain-containing protein [Planococcus sp. N022]
MNEGRVSRGAEKALGIIGIVFNLIVIASTIFLITNQDTFQSSPEFQQIEEEIKNNPSFANPQDAQAAADAFAASFGAVGWTLFALLAISTLFAILALLNLRRDKNPKLAGAFFIIAGLFAGILSLTSILFYIAAIMCFVRRAKRPRNDDTNYRDIDRDGRSDDLSRRNDDTRTGGTGSRTDDALHKKEDTPYRPL